MSRSMQMSTSMSTFWSPLLPAPFPIGASATPAPGSNGARRGWVLHASGLDFPLKK